MNLQIPQGDYGITYTFNVKQNVAGVISAKNLTGYTIMFKMWNPGKPGTLLINSACTVTDAANGVCTYTSISGNFDTPGEYLAELELTASGVVDSTSPFTINVTESG